VRVLSLCENLGAVSLAPLGLPGEAYQRKTALVRIEKLLAAEAYIEAVDPFSLAENGTITFLYQSWAYEDHQSLYGRWRTYLPITFPHHR